MTTDVGPDHPTDHRADHSGRSRPVADRRRPPRPAVRFLLGVVAVVVAAELTARGAIALADPVVLRYHDHTAALTLAQLDARSTDTRIGTEVVIVGTSMAKQDLDPTVIGEITGRSTYNAALEGGVPTVMGPWLLGPVLDRVDPSTVVWGLSALDLSATYGAGVERAYREAPATRDGLLADVERSTARFSTLVAARPVLRDPSLLAGEGREAARADLAAAAARLAADGQRRDFGRAVGVDRQREVAGRITPFAVDRADLIAVITTVSELRDRGIDVVLVELPVPQRFVELYPEGPSQHRLVSDTIAALGAELGVPVVTPSTAADQLGFVDFTHLDDASATAFSRSVADQLEPLLATPGGG